MEGPRTERLALLTATRTHVSPIFAIFDDDSEEEAGEGPLEDPLGGPSEFPGSGAAGSESCGSPEAGGAVRPCTLPVGDSPGQTIPKVPKASLRLPQGPGGILAGAHVPWRPEAFPIPSQPSPPECPAAVEAEGEEMVKLVAVEGGRCLRDDKIIWREILLRLPSN